MMEIEKHSSPPTSSKGQLLRALGPYTALAVVVGNVIGSGIFLKPGTIAAESGDFRLIISMWFVGGGLCILGALCLAELATMHPRAGGLYVYIREAYGKLPAFLFGWCEFLFARPAATGALAVAFVGAFLSAIGWAPPLFYTVLLATALIVVLALVNIIGVAWGGRVQLFVTIIKAAFLAIVALSPFLLAPIYGWTFDVANYGTHISPKQQGFSAQAGVVLLAIMWAYNGWHGVTPLAEEVRDPQRNIRFALFVGVGVLIVLYVGANLAYHGVLSMREMADAGNHAAENMLYKIAGPGGAYAVSLVIMCSTFGAINTNLLQSPRIPFAMGRDGVFFRSLGRIHANFRTPVIAISLTALMAVSLILVLAICRVALTDVSLTGIEWEWGRRFVQSLKEYSTFYILTNFVIFSMSIFYVLGVAAVIVLRFRQPNNERPYRAWGYPVTPVLFVLVYIWFLSQVFDSNPMESSVGLVLILLGAPMYWAYRKWGAGPS